MLFHCLRTLKMFVEFIGKKGHGMGVLIAGLPVRHCYPLILFLFLFDMTGYDLTQLATPL